MMTEMTQRLTDAIRTLAEASEEYSPVDLDVALVVAGDTISDDAIHDTKHVEAVVDGIRWGLSGIVHVRARRRWSR